MNHTMKISKQFTCDPLTTVSAPICCLLNDVCMVFSLSMTGVSGPALSPPGPGVTLCCSHHRQLGSGPARAGAGVTYCHNPAQSAPGELGARSCDPGHH